MKFSIGVDIGGTKVSIAIVNQNGEIIQKVKISTDLSIPPKEMINRIHSKIEKLIEKSGIAISDILGIGIGSPGPLDSKNGVITCPPNLVNWIDIPIVNWMNKKWNLPIFLENDANAAALAEKWIGAAHTNNNFVYLTVSTGIGAGVFVEGKLLRGIKGNAGDVGHTVVDPSFGKCICGQYGCLEAIASGAAIAKHASKVLGEKITTKEVFDLYLQGNREIINLIDKIFHVLGVACVSLINTFDPEKIVIGGGVSNVGDPMFRVIRNYVQNFALNPIGRKTEIVPAHLKHDSGVIGAAAQSFMENDMKTAMLFA